MVFDNSSTAFLKSRTYPNFVKPLVIRTHSDASTDSTFSINSFMSFKSSQKVRFLTRSLSEMLFESDWDSATEYVKANGRVARKKIFAPQFKNRLHTSELLPIHLALSRPDVPLSFLEALIFAYPKALTKKETSFGRNCLHIAFKSGVSDDIITYLIHRNPKLVEMQDTMGRLPLHYAISNSRSIEIIKELVHQYPSSLKAQDVSGWAPIHVAAGNNASLQLIIFLISVSPDVVLQKSYVRGKLPLQIARESEKDCEEGVIELIRATTELFIQTPAFKNYALAEKRKKKKYDGMANACFV